MWYLQEIFQFFILKNFQRHVNRNNLLKEHLKDENKIFRQLCFTLLPFTCKTYLIEELFFRNMQSLIKKIMTLQSNALPTSVLSLLDIFTTPKYLIFNL